MATLLKPVLLAPAFLTAFAATALIPPRLWAGQPATPPVSELPTDRAFDFWIARWTVTDNSDDAAAGENVIEVISNLRLARELD